MKLPCLFVALVVLLAGCSKTGEAVGEKITDFTKGVGKGIDQRMNVEVELAADVTALGLTHTIAKSLSLSTDKKGISVYFIATKPVATTLVVRALNDKGVEIGRSRKKVELGKDDAAYVTFEFDGQMDSTTVAKYGIGL